MKIIIDERERDLYDVFQNNIGSIPIEKTVLPLGDILLTNNDSTIINTKSEDLESNDVDRLDKPVLIIERKTIADLLASIKDGRYEEQSYRLIHTSQISLHNIVYIIEGTMANLRNPNERRLVLSAITSLNYFKGFSVFRTQSVIETGVLIQSMAEKIDRDLKKGKIPIYLSEPRTDVDSNDDMSTTTTAANVVTPYCSVVKKVKKENITTKNIGEIVLCQIPGISSVTAVAIMSRFSSFIHFIDTIRNNSAALENITYETNGKTRKISSACVKSIRTFLLNDTDNTVNKIECI